MFFWGSALRANSFYVDDDEIKREKGYTYFWVLVNFTKPEGASQYLSAKVKLKADCNRKRLKKLRVYVYNKKNAMELITSYSGFAWEYPPIKTISHAQLKFVCNRT